MTPRGGIKPHKRFAIQANRSEVLFVDYIAEHLTPKGRGGVIVPEGIIFQSGVAYKALRKMLLEQYLFAIVSLPAGVFNPYSGVKTSILLMDKSLAKKSQRILFVKITDDGYDLGAQRKEVKENDLPLAFEIINRFKESIAEGFNYELTDSEKKLSLLVDKNKINADYNLSMERYQERELYVGNWSLVELGDESLFSIESGGTPNSEIETYWNGAVRWATLADLPKENFVTEISDTQRKISDLGLKNSAAKLIPKNSVLVSSRATIGRIGINRVELATNQGFKIIIIKNKTRVDEKFVAFMVTNIVDKMDALASGGTFKEISKTSFSTLKIPLPPIEVQKEIVSEIESYQEIVVGAKKVVQNYSPKINESEQWGILEVGQICEIATGKLDANAAEKDGVYPFFTCSKTEIFGINKYAFDCEALLLSGNNASGDFDVKHYKGKFNAYQRTYVITIKDEFKNKVTYPLLNYYLQNSLASLKRQSIGGLTRYLTKSMITSIKIHVPPIETQKTLFTRIEEEQQIIQSNYRLIEIFEQKIKDEIKGVWGANE